MKNKKQFETGITRKVSFKYLHLDVENPRLPERSEPYSQSDLMKIFYRDYDLDELTESYAANGFFTSENLIVLSDGTVIEGNRRLAALKYLFHDNDAEEAGLPECDSLGQITDDNKKALCDNIPIQVVKDRNELVAYLGFRHINGTKEWPSASKARFVYMRVEYYAERDEKIDIFKRVGHEIGSNATGTRNWYTNYALIRQARDELNLQSLVAKLMLTKFGVWRRLCGEQVYRYIGFNSEAKSYDDIQESLSTLKQQEFEKLLQDIVPDESGNSLLNDSRRASDYTRILANNNAIQTLRETRDFDVALLVAEGSPINKRLEKVYSILELIEASVENGTPVDSSTHKFLQRINKKLKGIEGMISETDNS